MSRFRLPTFRGLSCTIDRIWEALGGRRSRGAGQPAFRRLMVDPLEERALLSLSPLDPYDILANQQNVGTPTALFGRSVAADHDGDFVATWSRTDQVFNPPTGQFISDANVYARYFTDQVERITLPSQVVESGVGQFTLIYGAYEGEIQKISITKTYEMLAPTGGESTTPRTQPTLSGSFSLQFNGVTTAGISYNESFVPSSNAAAIQSALRGLAFTQPAQAGALAGVWVEALNASDYLVHFAPPPTGQWSVGQPLITLPLSGFTATDTDLLPAVLTSTVKEPVTTHPISVVPGDPEHTAQLIQEAFRDLLVNLAVSDPVSYPSPYYVGPVTFPPPSDSPPRGPYDGSAVPLPRVTHQPIEVSVVPVELPGKVPGTVFDITFTGVSGKKDHSLTLPLTLVKDINAGAASSTPANLVSLGNTLFFAADNGTSGIELWKSDGTPGGTVMVKDIRAGAISSWPANLTAVGNTVFFTADDGASGVELWKSDGTAAGTVMVKNIRPLGASSSPANLTVVGNTLFFTADDGTSGVELWKSDGTDPGTVIVANIAAGAASSSPAYLTNVGGTLFFAANDGASGTELWKSNGTTAGTVIVANINPGAGSSSPAYLTNVNGTLYFSATDGVNGVELWKSNGTTAGTVMVANINPGAASSSPANLTAVGNTLFFAANDGVNGVELWKSNGTAATTVMVANINSAANSSSPAYLTNVNGTLFFSATTAAGGTELYRSDGSAIGTIRVKDIRTGLASSSPANLINVNGTLYFTASDGINGTELWKSDGTPNGTVMVMDLSPGTASSSPASLTVSNGVLFFSAADGTYGTELWKAVDKTWSALAVSTVLDGQGIPWAGASVSILKKPSAEFRVNAPEPDDPITHWPRKSAQINPAVAMDSDGDFVIAWQGDVPDDVTPGSTSDIFARRFSPSAFIENPAAVNPGDEPLVQCVRPLGGEFLVNTTTTNPQQTPLIAMDSDGNFAVVWANVGQEISFFNGISVQRYDRTGARVGNEIAVTTDNTAWDIHPYAALSSDGHLAVVWERTNDPNYIYGYGYATSTWAKIYDSAGQVALAAFSVGGAGRPTVALDTHNNFIVGWEENADPDNTNTGPTATSEGMYARMFSLDGTEIRPTFRVNSASFDTATTPLWPNYQGFGQVALDADGDLTISYQGFGADTSTDVYMSSSYFQRYFANGQNSDLLSYFPGYIISAIDVDDAIEQALIYAYTSGATREQVGRLRAILESTAGLMRSQNYGVMFSQFDADPQLGTRTILSSDDAAIAYRHGHNKRYFIAFDPTLDWDSVTVRITNPNAQGYEDVTIDIPKRNNFPDYSDPALINNIHNALTAASRVGTSWVERYFHGPVYVDHLAQFEVQDRLGTPWELDYYDSGTVVSVPTDWQVYEIVFQGEVHDTNILMVGRPSRVAGNDHDPPPITVMTYPEVPGTRRDQQASIAMQPDGSFVLAWMRQTDLGSQVYYRRFEESTDTAGPLVTDFLLPDGSSVRNGGQVAQFLPYMIVTFDEEMMTRSDSQFRVTNPDNWALLRDGVEVAGGISHVDYGLNKSVDLGIRPVGSNKFEAVVWLDANGNSPGVEPLTDGHYQIVARNTMEEKTGNPLGRTGFAPNGTNFSRSFDVFVPNSGETRVNTDPAGIQNIAPSEPQSPQAVAADGNGDFVAVWTSDNGSSKGVFVKMYTVSGRPSTTTVLSEFEVSYDPNGWNHRNWDYAYASVARDKDGDFLVTWSAADPADSTNTWDIYARRYDAAGNAIGLPFLVNTERQDIQKYSTVAMDVEGDFVITWQSLGQDGSGYGVYAQRYDQSGATVGGVDEVQQLTFIGNPVGTFALSWNGSSTGLITFNGNTFAAVPDIQAALQAIGAEVQVQATTLTDILVRFVGRSGSLNQPQMTVVNASLNPGARIGITTLIEGTPGEFLVNDTTANNQTFPTIAMNDKGGFVITWTSAGQDGDAPFETNIYAKRFAPNSVFQSTSTVSPPPVQATWTDGRVVVPLIVSADDPANHLVAPGTGYDGVAALDLHRTDGEFVGTGTLLSTGIHVLTAAHNVCDDLGTMVTTGVGVNFDTPTGRVTINSSQIYVLPGYTGIPWVSGHDLAIIVLQQAAPGIIERHDIYRSSDEVSRAFSKYGYGTSGTGATGNILPYGTKRSGQNRYDALADISGFYPDELAYDFDNGLAQNDAFGVLYGIHDLGLGNQEASGAPGDSGGPSFINGLIAGVTSYGYSLPGTFDVLPGTNFSFGDMGADVRVSQYAKWIDQVIFGGGAEFRVNQRVASDQKWSTIAMDADGDFVITWTGYNQDAGGAGPGGAVNGLAGVFARRFNSGATAISNEFQVNTFIEGPQEWSRVAMDADGDFLVTWESFQDRPQPPFVGPEVDPDVPNSFGIFAQRYARTALIGINPLLGPNGEIAGEMAINTTKNGDQRFPSIAMDDAGDFIIVWSGNGTQPGQEDNQGIFMQRFDQPKDEAGPTVVHVFDATGSTLTSIRDGTIVQSAVHKMVITFSEELSQVGGVDGLNSVLNVNNWQLSKDGAAILGAVTSVQFSLELPHRVAVEITFDGDPIEVGQQDLGPGTYVLTIRDSIQDVWGNALDGNFVGTPGGDFHRSFSIMLGTGGPIGPPPPGEPGPGAGDTPVNVVTANDQNSPAVASNAGGDYIVVWASYGQGTDALTEANIVAQRFDRYGRKQGNEFTVNTFTQGNQSEPDVATDVFGDIVITWAGQGATDDWGIYARRFDPFGTPIGSEFRVNTFTQSMQHAPSAAMDAEGNLVIAWSSFGQDGDRDGVYGQRYNLLGLPVGSEFRINTAIQGRQDMSDVAMDASGNFVVVWASDSQDEYGWGIFGQRYNAAGMVQGGEFRLNNYGINEQTTPQVAMDSDGDFVVTWASFLQDTSGYGVYARRYYKTGTPREAAEFRVNQTVANWQLAPAIDAASNGDFVITWQSMGQDNPNAIDYGVYARMFRDDGSDYIKPGTSQPLGEFRVNATVVGDQTDPAIAVDSDGDFVIVWVGPDAGGTGIYGRVTAVNSTLVFANGGPKPSAPNTGSTPGAFNPAASAFYLRNTNSGGYADAAFGYGPAGAGWTPLIGDWDGNGSDTIGLYDPATSRFYLKNANSGGYADITFNYGPGNLGWTPLVGDWDGSGNDTIGLYDPVASRFYLKNANSGGYADLTFTYGPGNVGWKPLVGDWDGNATETIGLYDPSASRFYLKNANSGGYADVTFNYGPPGAGWRPIVGDWDHNGTDTVGLYNPAAAAYYLRNVNAGGYADVSFSYGPAGVGWTPLAGHWSAGQALLAADPALPPAPTLAPLTQAELNPIVRQAVAQWAALRLPEKLAGSLANVAFVIADLSGAQLGLAYENVIYVDRDAAGHGWFVDPTPGGNEEFAAGADGQLRAIDPRAVDRIDLLSVVSHELGHVAGLEDLDFSAHSLMNGALQTGVRRLAGASEVDAVFAVHKLTD